MKLLIWVAAKITYIASSNFYFTRKRVCMTTKPCWPYLEPPCHDVYPAERTFHTNIISLLTFSIIYIFCFILISILALSYHRNSSASSPTLGLWPPVTVAVVAREIKDK